ncbi:MAG: hypothetical protein LBJ95_02775 [Oscillospiraceae bacterium]|nr:hypothetical protein [Oscillospiraceae bacterium]
MEIVKGLIVRSAAGRDKDNFFVVADCDSLYAYICDGKCRPISKLKKKKKKHLFVTNTLIDESSMESNRDIRKALSKFCTKV